MERKTAKEGGKGCQRKKNSFYGHESWAALFYRYLSVQVDIYKI